MSIVALWLKRGFLGGFNPATSPAKEILTRSGALVISRSGAQIVGR